VFHCISGTSPSRVVLSYLVAEPVPYDTADVGWEMANIAFTGFLEFGDMSKYRAYALAVKIFGGCWAELSDGSIDSLLYLHR
jgi:hypothetical protein